MVRALLLLAFAFPVAAQESLEGRARALLEARVASRSTVGIVAGLVAPDGLVTVISAGRSGNEARQAVDGLTLFEIGSITKVFTATLLAQQVERGRLTLATTVREAVPGIRAWKSPGVGDVTLGSLASHTSGLPRLPRDWRFFAGMVLNRADPYAGYTPDRLLDYASTAGGPGPGPHPVAYSNYGAGLLGEVLARREGLAWAALARRDILAPLAMGRTGTTTAGTDAALLARGHKEDLDPTGYWSLPGLAGAGALRSNVEELAKFLVAHRDGTLPGSRLTQQVRAKADKGSSPGLGWFIRPSGAGRILWHNGGTGGFRSFAGVHEGSKTGVIVLSNSANDVDEIGMALLEASVTP
ncbi:MAG TPA: serine hydrolase domain-containing protein [Usitatibacteraceae bacterium]|nr:serine hydrolase domain-containing protein [Usitatibacteraceae bacterium]